MAVFSNIKVWYDDVAHCGPVNMAIDQLLLEGVGDDPILRFYRWSRPEVSLGYFECLSEAKRSFPDAALYYVRRWTGGGTVDHRYDLTYTIIIPREHPVAKMRGAESYAIIHEAVARAMVACGRSCELQSERGGNGDSACFRNPVAYDVVDTKGRKLAGAGQRRSRHGLLHQGSVQGVEEGQVWRDHFLSALAENFELWRADEVIFDAAEAVAQERYRRVEWLEKRL